MLNMDGKRDDTWHLQCYLAVPDGRNATLYVMHTLHIPTSNQRPLHGFCVLVTTVRHGIDLQSVQTVCTIDVEDKMCCKRRRHRWQSP